MFELGSWYTRRQIRALYNPDEIDPRGGPWDTGYLNPQGTNDFVVFLNINVAGSVSGQKWKFDNYVDKVSQTVIGYGKPRTHSNQPLNRKVINGELKVRLFARWSKDKIDFQYLGEAVVSSYEDGAPIIKPDGTPSTAIKIQYELLDSEEQSVDRKEDLRIINADSEQTREMLYQLLYGKESQIANETAFEKTTEVKDEEDLLIEPDLKPKDLGFWRRLINFLKKIFSKFP